MTLQGAGQPRMNYGTNFEGHGLNFSCTICSERMRINFMRQVVFMLCRIHVRHQSHLAMFMPRASGLILLTGFEISKLTIICEEVLRTQQVFTRIKS